MKQLNPNCLYLLKFSLGRTNLIPNRTFLTLDNTNGYKCSFMAPSFLKDKPINVKLIKVIENDEYEAGRFAIDLKGPKRQEVPILSKSYKNCGRAIFTIES